MKSLREYTTADTRNKRCHKIASRRRDYYADGQKGLVPVKELKAAKL